MTEWISKIGVWYSMHFVVGALICALLTIVFVFQDGVIGWRTCAMPTIGTVAVFILSLMKEMSDNVWDWKDVRCSLYGCILVYIVTFFGVLFNILSH